LFRSRARSPARALLVRGALGRRQDFEAFVRNRLAAFDRESVGAVDETLLGSFDGRELLAQVVFQALVELVLVEIGGEVCRIELIGRLAVVLACPPGERALDPRALGRQ